MSHAVAFEQHRFEAAAAHYVAGRSAYPRRLIARVCQLCGIGAEARVMDLGCGPGLLARLLAPLAGQVLAVDPAPAMLALAREACAGFANVEIRAGSSYDLTPQWGRFQAVVIGRAFHWMDREATLAALDALIEPGGAVVLFGDNHPPVAENAWRRAFRGVVERYAGDDPAHLTRQAPGWKRTEAVLLDGPFPVLERVSVIERRRTAVASMIERALSLSAVARTAEPAAIAAEIEAALAPFASEGAISEVVASAALMATRK